MGCLTTGSMYVTTFEKELCCVEDLATITTGPMKIVEDVKQCHDYREANLWQATGLLVAGEFSPFMCTCRLSSHALFSFQLVSS